MYSGNKGIRESPTYSLHTKSDYISLSNDNRHINQVPSRFTPGQLSPMSLAQKLRFFTYWLTCTNVQFSKPSAVARQPRYVSLQGSRLQPTRKHLEMASIVTAKTLTAFQPFQNSNFKATPDAAAEVTNATPRRATSRFHKPFEFVRRVQSQGQRACFTHPPCPTFVAHYYNCTRRCIECMCRPAPLNGL